jgi:hypothetical protein
VDDILIGGLGKPFKRVEQVKLPGPRVGFEQKHRALAKADAAFGYIPFQVRQPADHAL